MFLLAYVVREIAIMDSSTLEKAPSPATIAPSSEFERRLPEAQISLRSATWAGWLFLAGSLVLVVDAILENLEGITLPSLLHLGGSLLFALGSILLVPRRPRS